MYKICHNFNSLSIIIYEKSYMTQEVDRNEPILFYFLSKGTGRKKSA